MSNILTHSQKLAKLRTDLEFKISNYLKTHYGREYGHYSNINVYDSNDNMRGRIEIRVKDHSENPANIKISLAWY